MNRARLLRIVLSGGNGQVGNILARYFHAQGHSVTVLARKPYAAPWRVVPWDGVNLGEWTRKLENADVVINLAGRNVNCRYTAAHRREIMDSRVRSTRVLGEAIERLSAAPRVWLNSSTATIYRHVFDHPMDEATGEIGGNEADAPRSWGFSIQVARAWEEAFFAAATLRTRKIALRSSVILSPDRGGIFDVLLRLVRFGLGGTSGSGRQFVSWIHDADFARAIDFLIAHEELSGIVNVAAPNPLPNSEFMGDLRKAWGTHIGLPASKWMLEFGAVFLRTETELVLKSRRVVPGRLLASGFEFQFPDWGAAARDLVRRWRESATHRRA
ncbi:MAG: TIGR01777 family oxidoreductase [Candidatus Acidiferrales bacterium]